MSEKKNTDDWMGILPDAERAAVLKKQIEEEQQTERARISNETELQKDFGYQFVRFTAVVAVAGVIAAALYAYVAVHAPNAITPASSAPQGKP